MKMFVIQNIFLVLLATFNAACRHFVATALAPAKISAITGRPKLWAKSREDVVENKCTHLPLLEKEEIYLKFGMPPISTATLLSGDDAESIEVQLKSRLRKMLAMNPWLAGRFAKTEEKKHTITFIPPEARSTRTNLEDYFQILNDDRGLSEFGADSMDSVKYQQFTKRCAPLCLGSKAQEKNPFFKVVLVPNNDRKTQAEKSHWVVFSMSHVIGDGHTYYTILSMLLGTRPIASLNAERFAETRLLQKDVMGSIEEGIACSWGNILCCVWGCLQSKILSFTTKKSHFETLILHVDKNMIDRMKTEHSTHDSFVSTNDILTSWVLRNSGCEHGLMPINIRGRIEGHEEDLAGNYINHIYYRIPDDIVTPQLIRSSVKQLKRVVTHEKPYSNFRLATQTQAVVTNWSTFCPKSQDMRLHVPLFRSLDEIPHTGIACTIYQETPKQLTLLILAPPKKIERLRNTSGPFLPSPIEEEALAVKEEYTFRPSLVAKMRKGALGRARRKLAYIFVGRSSSSRVNLVDEFV